MNKNSLGQQYCCWSLLLLEYRPVLHVKLDSNDATMLKFFSLNSSFSGTLISICCLMCLNVLNDWNLTGQKLKRAWSSVDPPAGGANGAFSPECCSPCTDKIQVSGSCWDCSGKVLTAVAVTCGGTTDLLAELNTGSAPDFEAKKHDGQTVQLQRWRLSRAHFFHKLKFYKACVPYRTNWVYISVTSNDGLTIQIIL